MLKENREQKYLKMSCLEVGIEYFPPSLHDWNFTACFLASRKPPALPSELRSHGSQQHPGRLPAPVSARAHGTAPSAAAPPGKLDRSHRGPRDGWGLLSPELGCSSRELWETQRGSSELGRLGASWSKPCHLHSTEGALGKRGPAQRTRASGKPVRRCGAPRSGGGGISPCLPRVLFPEFPHSVLCITAVLKPWGSQSLLFPALRCWNRGVDTHLR